jgi:hypothetical protein
MNIYEYNSSTINEYSQEEFGLLSNSSWETDDCGNLYQEVEFCTDLYMINCTETLVPFGKLKIFNKTTEYHKKSSIFEKYFDLNFKSIIFSGIIIRWIGFSIIFQLSNDLQRKVIPDVSGGGYK